MSSMRLPKRNAFSSPMMEMKKNKFKGSGRSERSPKREKNTKFSRRKARSLRNVDPDTLAKKIEAERKKCEMLRKERDVINHAIKEKKDVSGVELAISSLDEKPMRRFRSGREDLRRDTKKVRQQLIRRRKLVVQNSALRDVASAKLTKITNALKEVKETKTLLLRTLNVLVNRLRDSTISKEDNSEMLRMLDPYIRYLMNSQKQDEMPPPPPFVDDSGVLENESMIMRLLESLSLPFSAEENEKLVLLLAGKRSTQVPMQLNVDIPSTLYGEEADEEEEEEEEEEAYRQQPDVNTLKPTPLIHRPAFGSSTPTMRRPEGEKASTSFKRQSVWMGDDGERGVKRTIKKVLSPRSRRKQEALQVKSTCSPQQVAAFVHKFTTSQRKKKMGSSMKKSDARSESPSKLDDSGIFASPYPTYVVFEREAREFQSFHFFVFQLYRSNHKNATRITHSLPQENYLKINSRMRTRL